MVLERIALAFATVLNAISLYAVPSWLDALADPCRQALIASALVIVLLYVTRFFEPRSFAIERIVLAVFLAAMPVVDWRGGSLRAEPLTSPG